MRLENKRRNVTATGIVPVRVAVFVVLLPAICLGYLSLTNRCEALGKELKALDVEIAELNQKCLQEELRWTRMKSPGEMEKALRRWRLAMTWPDDQQIVRLTPSDVLDAFAPASLAKRTQYAQVGRVVMHD